MNRDITASGSTFSLEHLNIYWPNGVVDIEYDFLVHLFLDDDLVGELMITNLVLRPIEDNAAEIDAIHAYTKSFKQRIVKHR